MKKKYLVFLGLALALTGCGQEDIPLEEDLVQEEVQEEVQVQEDYVELEGELVAEGDQIKKFQEDLEAIQYRDLDIVHFSQGNFYGLGHNSQVQPFIVSFKGESREGPAEDYGFIDGTTEYYSPDYYYFIRDDEARRVMLMELEDLNLIELDALEDKRALELLYVGEGTYNYLAQDDDYISYIYVGREEDGEIFAEEINLIGSSYYGKNLKLDRISNEILSQEKTEEGFRNLMVAAKNSTKEYEIEGELDLVSNDGQAIVLEGLVGGRRTLYIYDVLGEDLGPGEDISHVPSRISYREGQLSYLTDTGHIYSRDLASGEEIYLSLRNLDEDLEAVESQVYKYKEAFYLRLADKEGDRPDRFYQIAYGADL